MANIEDKIINATWALIKKFGVQNLRVNDIAREADISKRTLYKYFPSKNELISFIFAKRQGEVLKQLNGILSGDEKELVKYDKFLHFIKNQLSERDYRFIDYLKRENPELHQKIIEGQNRFQVKMQSLIERGIEKNEINSDLDPEIISYLVIKLANSIVEPEYFMQNSITVEQVFHNLKELLINGLKRRD